MGLGGPHRLVPHHTPRSWHQERFLLKLVVPVEGARCWLHPLATPCPSCCSTEEGAAALGTVFCGGAALGKSMNLQHWPWMSLNQGSVFRVCSWVVRGEETSLRTVFSCVLVLRWRLERVLFPSSISESSCFPGSGAGGGASSVRLLPITTFRTPGCCWGRACSAPTPLRHLTVCGVRAWCVCPRCPRWCHRAEPPSAQARPVPWCACPCSCCALNPTYSWKKEKWLFQGLLPGLFHGAAPGSVPMLRWLQQHLLRWAAASRGWSSPLAPEGLRA